MVWHHDITTFLPNEVNKHFFYGDDFSCEIHPFLGEKGNLPAFAFEVMKIAQPNVVISIGSAQDVEFLWVFKSIYPHLFKWLALVPSGSDYLAEKFRIPMGYADHIVVTTSSALDAFSSVKTEVSQLSYGPCRDVFYPVDGLLPRQVAALNMGKNMQISNVPAFIRSIADSKISGTIHSNIDDDGEYDIKGAIKRFGVKERIRLPDKYVSIREGITDSLVNELYNRHHLIVDCSMESATALTLLEAMSTGCVPVGMDFGAVGEVIRKIPSEFRFEIPYETIEGSDEEDLAVISKKELSSVLNNISRRHLVDPNWFMEARKVSIETARIFSKDLFDTGITEVLETIVTNDHKISIDTF